MSQSYPYTKASVNEDKLTLEIEADETIEKTLEEINWTAPDSLSITFDQALTGGEETALDTLVTNHDGNPPTTYTIFCYDCGRSNSKEALSALTECPVCSGTDIQDAYHNDNLDATTNPGVSNDGTEGYCEGSKWLNVTLDKAFVCLDNTTDAAVWKEVNIVPNPLITSDSGVDFCFVNEEDAMTSDGYLYQWFPFHGYFASPPGSVTLSNISYVNCSNATVTKITKSGFILRVDNAWGLGRHECEFDWSA